MPQNTQTALHFERTKTHGKDLFQTLHNIPLISDRNLTISDILPFTNGELALFLQEDGTRSIAVRSSTNQIPFEQLDALGIIVQEINPTTFLLSPQAQPVRTEPLGRTWRFPYIWPTQKRLGTLMIIDETVQKGTILKKDDRVIFKIKTEPTSVNSTLPEGLPPGSIAAMSTPALSKIDTSWITHTFMPLTEGFQAPNLTTMASDILSNPGHLLLANNEGFPFFLISTTQEALPTSIQTDLLRTISALKSPTIRELTLPDQTIVRELIADPSITTIEEKTLFGTPVLHTQTNTSEDFFLANRDNQVAFTNNESLLEHWLNPETPQDHQNSTCGANTAFISLSSFDSITSQNLIFRQSSLLRSLSANFTTLGVRVTKRSASLILCK